MKPGRSANAVVKGAHGTAWARRGRWATSCATPKGPRTGPSWARSCTASSITMEKAGASCETSSMPTHWFRSVAFFAAALVVCSCQYRYRPAAPRRTAQGGASFEAAYSCQYRYRPATPRRTAQASASFEVRPCPEPRGSRRLLRLAPAWRPACRGGVAAKEVRTGGPISLSRSTCRASGRSRSRARTRPWVSPATRD